jgi:predicted dithiol-disulfide oxidoreductase (DUF899 family)
MLYFSESGWTLPDIDEVSEAFDRDYDQTLYEQKIANLAGNFRAKARKDNRDEFETWNEALRVLRHEDHYLLVLIDSPPSVKLAKQLDAPASSRFVQLSIFGLILACVALVVGYLLLRN